MGGNYDRATPRYCRGHRCAGECGRATVCAFARRGLESGCWLEGETDWRGVQGRGSIQREGAGVADGRLRSGTGQGCSFGLEEVFGPIEGWVNNAMVTVLSPVKEMTPTEFRRVTEVIYLGYAYGTRAALKRMLPRDEGVIVQVGLRSGLSIHSSSVGLLRGKARRHGLHGVLVVGAVPRRQQSPGAHRPTPRREYVSVLVGQEQPDASPPAGLCRLFSGPRWRRRRS